MADKEVKKEPIESKNAKAAPEKGAEKTTPVTSAPDEPRINTAPGAAPVAAAHKKRTFVIVLLSGIIVLYVLAIMAGLWIYTHVEDRRAQQYGGASYLRQSNGGPRFNGEHTYTVRSSTSDGLTTTTTNETYTQTQGVVTAVSGDSVTVAGGGKTQVIKTNGDTSYLGDVKPSVNDTVVIVGTKDGDTITATEIRVYTYEN